MGMFDYVKCEYPLPDDGPQHVVFQSKDLPHLLFDNFVITKNGRLIHKVYNSYIDTNFHGEIRFCDLTEKKEWFEYSALFNDGQLIVIKRLKENAR